MKFPTGVHRHRCQSSEYNVYLPEVLVCPVFLNVYYKGFTYRLQGWLRVMGLHYETVMASSVSSSSSAPITWPEKVKQWNLTLFQWTEKPLRFFILLSNGAANATMKCWSVSWRIWMLCSHWRKNKKASRPGHRIALAVIVNLIIPALFSIPQVRWW